MTMSPLQCLRRPLCPFLYPPHYRQTIRHLHFKPSEPRCRKAMSVQRLEKIDKAEYKNDLGLLQGTFVRPTGSRLPSMLRQPKQRLQLEWYWVKRKFSAATMLFMYKWWMGVKPRPKLKRRKLGPLAQVKHRELFTALAEGDIPTLRKTCTEGILTSFRTRINSRPKNEINRWTLHRYLGMPRIVSTRMGRLPVDKSAIMQVVVKVKSIQSLEKIIAGRDGNATKIMGGDKQKTVEYLVLQRMMIEGEEQPWMVWGTTQESRIEDVLSEENTIGSPESSHH